MYVRAEYQMRPVRFLDLWEPLSAWRIKMYGITYRKETPDAGLIKAGQLIAEARLRGIAPDTHHQVGFLGIHQAQSRNLVFLNWWTNENELHHHPYVSTKEAPTHLQYALPDGPAMSVWDIKLIAFERDAWVECVLANEDEPNLEAYLERRMSAEV